LWIAFSTVERLPGGSDLPTNENWALKSSVLRTVGISMCRRVFGVSPFIHLSRKEELELFKRAKAASTPDEIAQTFSFNSSLLRKD
jgi:hypothetical protein